MKKLLLVLSMSFFAMSYSYGYSNSVDLFLQSYETYGGDEDFVYANVNSYCEFQFSVSATAVHSYAGSYGYASVSHGGPTVDYVYFDRYSNDPTGFGYSSTHTGQWYSLMLKMVIGNYIAHASIRW